MSLDNEDCMFLVIGGGRLRGGVSLDFAGLCRVFVHPGLVQRLPLSFPVEFCRCPEFREIGQRLMTGRHMVRSFIRTVGIYNLPALSF